MALQSVSLHCFFYPMPMGIRFGRIGTVLLLDMDGGKDYTGCICEKQQCEQDVVRFEGNFLAGVLEDLPRILELGA